TAGADNRTFGVGRSGLLSIRTHWFSVKMHESVPEVPLRTTSAKAEVVKPERKFPRTETAWGPGPAALTRTADESARITDWLVFNGPTCSSRCLRELYG